MDSVKITQNLFSYKISLFESFPHVIKDGCIPMSQADKEESALYRAKKKIREYSFNNLWNYFITITISKKNYDRYKDKEKIVKRILKYFDNFRQQVDSTFRYLLVPELHADGAIHFHGFIIMSDKTQLTFQYYDRKYHRAIYSHDKLLKNFGRTQFVLIQSHCIASANYISKYLGKGSKKIFNRYYYASKGLNFDKVIYSGFGLSNLVFDVATNLQLKIKRGEYTYSIYLDEHRMGKFVDSFISLGRRFDYIIPSFAWMI